MPARSAQLLGTASVRRERKRTVAKNLGGKCDYCNALCRLDTGRSVCAECDKTLRRGGEPAQLLLANAAIAVAFNAWLAGRTPAERDNS